MLPQSIQIVALQETLYNIMTSKFCDAPPQRKIYETPCVIQELYSSQCLSCFPCSVGTEPRVFLERHLHLHSPEGRREGWEEEYVYERNKEKNHEYMYMVDFMFHTHTPVHVHNI